MHDTKILKTNGQHDRPEVHTEIWRSRRNVTAPQNLQRAPKSRPGSAIVR
jgi:hypothetical protein